MYQLLCSLKCVLGYEFAGLRGSRCHCGNDPNKYSEQSREDCNVTCNSDSELTCGGLAMNSVFKTEVYSKYTHATYNIWQLIYQIQTAFQLYYTATLKYNIYKAGYMISIIEIL